MADLETRVGTLEKGIDNVYTNLTYVARQVESNRVQIGELTAEVQKEQPLSDIDANAIGFGVGGLGLGVGLGMAVMATSVHAKLKKLAIKQDDKEIDNTVS